MARDRMFKLRMTAAEVARLEALASHYDLSAASVLRMLVKRDADAVERMAAERSDGT